jgi:hypothetical protein
MDMISHGDSLDCQPTVRAALDAFRECPVAA